MPNSSPPKPPKMAAMEWSILWRDDKLQSEPLPSLLTFTQLKAMVDLRSAALDHSSGIIGGILAEQCMGWRRKEGEQPTIWRWLTESGEFRGMDHLDWDPLIDHEQAACCTAVLLLRGWQPKLTQAGMKHMSRHYWAFEMDRFEDGKHLYHVSAIHANRVTAESLACALACLWDKENGGENIHE